MTNSTFTLKQTNAVGGTGLLYNIVVHEHAEDAAREEAIAASSHTMASHKDAMYVMQAGLQMKRELLLQELALVDYNLDNLNTLYEMPPTLVPLVKASFEQLVVQFHQLKATPGDFEMHSVRVSNQYLHAGPELFVFQLPEYAAVIQTFTQPLCDLLQRAMQEAGLKIYADWNGPGQTTWSVKARAAVPGAPA